MVKMGKILKRVHQECHSHGLHLAVTDVLYKKKTTQAEVVEEAVLSSDDESEESEDENDDVDDVTDSDESDEESESENEEPEESPEDMVLISEIDLIVKQIRTIVKKFKRSPLKNDELQKYIKEEIRKKPAGMVSLCRKFETGLFS